MQATGYFFFLVYVALIFVRPQEYISLVKGLPLPLITEALTALFWMLARKRFDAPQYKYLIFFTLVIFLSTTRAVGVSMAFKTTSDFVMQVLLVFVFLANFVDTPERQIKFLKLFVAGTTLISVHSLFQSINPQHVGWTGVEMYERTDSGPKPVWQIRYLGIFADPNDLGMVIVCALPMIVYLLQQSKGKIGKLLWLVVLGLHLHTVYLTNSRGTMLATGAILACWGILRYGGVKVLVPMAFLALIAPMLLPSRMSVSGDASSQERIDAWFQGLLMFRSHPLLGVGKDRFTEYNYLTAHNSWVLAFSELGFAGFYFWVSLLFVSFYMVWQIRSQSPASVDVDIQARYAKERQLASVTMFAMVGVFVSAFFISRTYTIVLYIVAGLATAQYHRITRNFPDIVIKSMWGWMFLISIGFIMLVEVIVRVKS